MTNHRNRHPARRRFLKQSAALTAQVATLAAPAVVLAKVAAPADTPEPLTTVVPAKPVRAPR
jgi:hypothetical protein